MYRHDSGPEYSTRIPYVSSMPPYITARHILQFTPWKLHTQKKKNDVSSQGPCCSGKKRKTRYVLSLYLPKHSNLPNINARLREHPQHDMYSHCTCPSIHICRTSMLVFESIRNTICALTVPAQAFTSAEHQCSSSRASATRYVLSLYLPKHSNLPNINARLREHPQPTSRMPHCVACHPCR